MNIGVVFASTGGEKMARALRSFRRSEPTFPVHIVLDVASNTWKDNPGIPPEWFVQQPGVALRCFESEFYLNGTFNEAVRWMRELGYEYVCLFHDDVIFSPLINHVEYIQQCLDLIEGDDRLRNASGISLPYIQAFSDKIVWRRAPSEWNVLDLESEFLWRQLCPNGKPAGYWDVKDGPSGTDDPGVPRSIKVPEIQYQDFLAFYCVVPEIRKQYRLGPPGQIFPIKAWEAVGGFDQTFGIFYDEDFPAACVSQNLPPVYVVPGVPFLHLHNQSVGYADPSTNLYGEHSEAFKKKFGATVRDFFGDRP